MSGVGRQPSAPVRHQGAKRVDQQGPRESVQRTDRPRVRGQPPVRQHRRAFRAAEPQAAREAVLRAGG